MIDDEDCMDDYPYKENAAHPAPKSADKTINESIYAAMYGSDKVSDRPRSQVPGLPPDKTLSMQTLLEMIIRLQAQVTEQDRMMRKLANQVIALSRNSKHASRSIDDLYYEMDFKVTRRD